MHKYCQMNVRRAALVWSLFLGAVFPLSSSGLASTVALPEIPKTVVNLTDYGAVGDGLTLNTDAFAKALAALREKGGGELIVPAGFWLTGPITLQSNLNLHLDRGALIKFSGDCQLYPLIS